jgi:DNA-binding NtrC family response regulator
MLAQLCFLDSRRSPIPLVRSKTRIGRGAGNDVVIDDPEVRSSHAILRRGSDGYTIRDVSGEGVFLNGRRVYAASLEAADTLRIGGQAVRLAACAHAPTLRALADITRGGASSAVPHVVPGDLCLRWSRGGEVSVIPIDRRGVFVGSSPDTDVVIRDVTISRWHTRLTPTPGGLEVEDLASENGVWVNGVRIERALVPVGAELRLGDVVLQVLDAAEALAARLALPSFHGLVGDSEPMRDVFRQIRVASPTRDPILVYGETGTGKELVARAVHACSSRRRAAFVALNCAALPREIVESELFGHERGAFSGAHSARKGLFEEAHEGTLFLDEIAELPMETQAKLLRVLEGGEVRRLGGNSVRRVDARVVAACNRRLVDLVHEGRFRMDLLQRLRVIEITIPPLRDRTADLGPLSAHFLSAENGGCDKIVSAAALERLAEYPWPGNVRELRNVLRRASLRARGAILEPVHFDVLTGAQPAPAVGPLRLLERAAIAAAIEHAGGNKTAASRALGISRSTLNFKRKRLGL